MEEWIAANAMLLALILGPAAIVVFSLTVVLLVAWVRARSRVRRISCDRSAADNARIELELSLAEQTGRLRVIRELHELSVHAISTVISRADGIRYTAERDPAAAARAAGSIAETVRATQADLRRVMSVVREGEASVEPQPQLRSTRDLFAIMRDSGLDVVFEERGTPVDLIQGVELAVYRILQEALANVLTYGGVGTQARVAFTWSGEGLQIIVDDDGARAAARREGIDPNDAKQRAYTLDDDLHALTDTVTGQGIREMRSRAELYGGILTASPVPGVGFTVTVVFPSIRSTTTAPPLPAPTSTT
jgi:signal transduction histidine kinase